MTEKEIWINNIKDGIRRAKENETKEERERKRENRSNKMKEYWEKVHKALAKVQEDK